MDKKELIKWALDKDVESCIYKAFKRYGIEGTENKIKEVYKLVPKMKEYMLNKYYEIINGNNKIDDRSI